MQHPDHGKSPELQIFHKYLGHGQNDFKLSGISIMEIVAF